MAITELFENYDPMVSDPINLYPLVGFCIFLGLFIGIGAFFWLDR